MHSIANKWDGLPPQNSVERLTDYEVNMDSSPPSIRIYRYVVGGDDPADLHRAGVWINSPDMAGDGIAGYGRTRRTNRCS